MTFDSDIRRLRLAAGATAGLAAVVALVLFFQGLYLSGASFCVLCLCNVVALGTLKAYQKTRDLYREIGRMKSRQGWTTTSKN